MNRGPSQPERNIQMQLSFFSLVVEIHAKDKHISVQESLWLPELYIMGISCHTLYMKLAISFKISEIKARPALGSVSDQKLLRIATWKPRALAEF